MPIYLKEQDAVEFADMRTVVAVLRNTLAAQGNGTAVNVPRRRLDFGKGRLNVMAGGSSVSSRHVVKCYGSSAHHMLLYSTDGGLLAIMEAGGLGAIRTGAAR